MTDISGQIADGTSRCRRNWEAMASEACLTAASTSVQHSTAGRARQVLPTVVTVSVGAMQPWRRSHREQHDRKRLLPCASHRDDPSKR